MKIKVVLMFLLLSTIACKKESKKINSVTDNYIVAQGKHCFESVIENEIKNGNEIIVEKDYLNVDLMITGSKVIGNYNFKANNSTVSMGVFEGDIDKNIITSIYSYKQKENQLKEEIIFNIQANKISLLGGEKELKNGISYFKDKSQGIYMIEIPRIDCK